MYKILVATVIVFLAGAFAMGASYRSLFKKCAPMTVEIVNPVAKRIGTGVFIDSTHVLTAAHLLEHGTDELLILAYPDGLTAHGTMVGMDRKSDLALISLDNELFDTTWVQLSPELPTIGDNLLVIGSGAGLPWTATQGIMSGKDRLSKKFSQTDALINPGNSGGPVFDMKGRLVGIVDAKIFSADDLVEGIGLFIPIDQIRTFLKRYTVVL